MNQYSKKYNLNAYGEPFNVSTNLDDGWKTNDNVVVKTMLRHVPKGVTSDKEYWIEMSKSFDEVILLSRKDLFDCAKSYSFMIDMNKEYDSANPYIWEETPSLNKSFEFLKVEHKKLEEVSKLLKIPITYYEDIFDINSKERYRKSNKHTI
tara:strand:+ start:91 stop:543 length:453 start_codon:yes stop_codon:yes gene_type:complete